MKLFTMVWWVVFSWQGPAPSWDDVLTQLKSLPTMTEQAAKASGLEAEKGQLQASFQPQIQAQAQWLSTTNPVAVFSGRLGNGEFRMEDFGIPQPDGTFDTYPVNHPDAYTDAVVDLTAGYRLFDGGTRAAMRRELQGMGQALQAATAQSWQELLGAYAQRSIHLAVLSGQATKAGDVVQDTREVVAKLEALFHEKQIPQLSLSMAQTSLAQAEAEFEGLNAQRRAEERALAVWLDLNATAFPVPPQLDLTAIADAGIDHKTNAEKAAAEMAMALDQRQGRIRDRWVPVVDGFAKLESHQLSSQNWTVGIQANWKLWDGGGDRHLKAKYRAEAAEARASQEKVTRMMAQRRTELREHLIAAGARIEALEKAVNTARSSWETHKALLDEGQLDQGTVFEVRAMLLDAEAKLIAANGQAQILGWQILNATGVDLEPYLRGARK